MLATLKNLFKGSISGHTKGYVDKGAVIIDVRTSYEFKSGHIHGSKNIPLDSLPGKINALKKLNRPVMIVCKSDLRGEMARELLAAAGIDVFNGGRWIDFK